MNNRDYNQIARSDIGDLLVHWTRRSNRYEAITPAFDNLKNILENSRINGGTGKIRGGYTCVCFTESPLSNLVNVFSLAKINEGKSSRTKYEPYGVGIRKEWLFKKGGRPVIYGSSAEYNDLPDSLKWRYVNYSPPSVDFTWEREWRIQTDYLELDPEQTVVIVPNREKVLELNSLISDEWLTLTLSILGLPANWVD